MNNGTGIPLGPKVAGQYQYLSKTFPGRWYNCTYAEAQKAFADQYAIQVLVPDGSPVGKHVMVGVDGDDGGSAQCLGCRQYVYGSLTELPPGDCPTPYKSPERLLAESVAREAALQEELDRYKSLFDQSQKAIDRVHALHRKRLASLHDCHIALEAIIAAVDHCEEDQDVGLADVFTQRLETAARAALAKAKVVAPAPVPFVFNDSPDGAAAEAVYQRQVAAHEVLGTSFQRLNQLANEGE